MYCSPECQRADWRRHKPECADFCRVTGGAEVLKAQPGSPTPSPPSGPCELPLGTSVRLYGLVSTPLRNGTDGVVEGPLLDGRQRVRLLPAAGPPGSARPAPDEVLAVKPQNLLEVAPASAAFARAAVLLTMNAAVTLANLHYGWRAQSGDDYPYPPILHIEIAAGAAGGAAPAFSPPARWRAQAFFPDVPGMAAEAGAPPPHWLNGTPQVGTFLESATLEVLRPEGRAGATPMGDALRSGEAVFVLVTLSRPDRRYVHAILLHHAVAMHELRANRARVVAAANKAGLRGKGGGEGADAAAAGGSLGACALRLCRCTAFCVEPTEGAAEAATVLSERFRAMFTKLYDGGDGSDHPAGSARTPVLGLLVAPPLQAEAGGAPLLSN